MSLLWGSVCHHVEREASRFRPDYAPMQVPASVLMAIAGQVELVPADELRGELIRGAHEVAHKVVDTAHVALPGVGAIPTDAEIFVHPVAESPHDVLL